MRNVSAKRIKITMLTLSAFIVLAGLIYSLSENSIGEFRQTHRMNGLDFSITYVSPNQLAGQEVNMLQASFNEQQLDSLTVRYENSLCYDLIITPAGDESPYFGNIAALGASSEQGYTLRKYILNFKLQDYLGLIHKNVLLKPVLTEAEVVQGKDELKIRLVFPASVKDIDNSNYQIVFEDPFWDSGAVTFLQSN
jgi:hypothetical protein